MNSWLNEGVLGTGYMTGGGGGALLTIITFEVGTGAGTSKASRGDAVADHRGRWALLTRWIARSTTTSQPSSLPLSAATSITCPSSPLPPEISMMPTDSYGRGGRRSTNTGGT